MSENLLYRYYIEGNSDCVYSILRVVSSLWNIELPPKCKDLVQNEGGPAEDGNCRALYCAIALLDVLLKDVPAQEKAVAELVESMIEIFESHYGTTRCHTIKQLCYRGDRRCLPVLLKIMEVLHELMDTVDNIYDMQSV